MGCKIVIVQSVAEFITFNLTVGSQAEALFTDAVGYIMVRRVQNFQCLVSVCRFEGIV